MACQYPILNPINPSGTELIWLVCDASLYGVSTLYGQGPDWKTSCPVGFMSKKLSDAQQNYRTFECKTLAIIEALLKWEDKLLRFRFTIVGNHEALRYLNTQQKLLSRQICWINYILLQFFSSFTNSFVLSSIVVITSSLVCVAMSMFLFF